MDGEQTPIYQARPLLPKVQRKFVLVPSSSLSEPVANELRNRLRFKRHSTLLHRKCLFDFERTTLSIAHSSPDDQFDYRTS